MKNKTYRLSLSWGDKDKIYWIWEISIIAASPKEAFKLAKKKVEESGHSLDYKIKIKE